MISIWQPRWNYLTEETDDSSDDSNDDEVRTYVELRNCLCGFNPHENIMIMVIENDYHTCDITTPLQNHLVFPPMNLTIKHDLAKFGNIRDELPRRHWASLLEIRQNIISPHRSIIGVNRFGEQVRVNFSDAENSPPAPTTFSFDDFDPYSSTLAIFYPQKKQLHDGSTGFALFDTTELNSVYVFKASLEILQLEASTLLLNADRVRAKKRPGCSYCGFHFPLKKKCSGCNLAIYCRTSCMQYHYYESHKDLCPQFEAILRLACLQRQSVDYFINFEDFE